MLTGSVSLSVKALLLPLVVMCSVLMALSFARDYETGLTQSILSLPVSRKMFFVAKFFAIILPLTLLSWGFITFFAGLTFYPEFWLVLKSSLFAVPVIFLILMFCGGIGVLGSLIIKRTIPSVLAVLLVSIFFWYPTTINTVYALMEGVGYAKYLCLTPYKGALVFLDKLIGYTPMAIMAPEGVLEFSLSTSSFGILVIFYACILVIPLFVYFCRRFEICE
jgi:ABC-type transport system involved in multi-copper enzyme maturation permease subunit